MAIVSPTNSTITYAELISETDIQQWVTSLVALASFLRNGVAYTGLANGAEMLPNWTARAYNDANISHTNNGGWQTITFNQELWDSGSIHSTSSQTDRFVMPVTGIYVATCSVLWASSATGNRGVRVQRNGASTEGGEAYSVSGSSTTNGTWLIACTSASQYLTFDSFQNSGGNLNMTTASAYGIHASMAWVGKAS